MLSFSCDYSEGAHPEILKRLAETNLESCPGYGMDTYTIKAKEKIRRACACPEADVYFLAGGTQTNAVVISAMLKGYQGVVCAHTGHIGVHEAGAIEYTGHKVLPISQHEGKIKAEDLAAYVSGFYADETCSHMVFPGMVYLSHPTEYGTLYTKKELLDIREVCRRYGLLLYMDGARLGYGLAAEGTDVDLPLIGECCDAFYIGGTKVGAFCGEAVVFPRNNAPEHFFTTVKQHGALMAKGRFLGIQFDTLFTRDLYGEIGRHAIEMAELLKKTFLDCGYELYLDSPTNQQFVILPNDQLEELKKSCAFSYWEPFDEEHTVIRFATSWATQKESVDALGALLRAVRKKEI